MTESDYILMQRMTNVRTAYNILSDCTIENGSLLQGILVLLVSERDTLSAQLGNLEIKEDN